MINSILKISCSLLLLLTIACNSSENIDQALDKQQEDLYQYYLEKYGARGLVNPPSITLYENYRSFTEEEIESYVINSVETMEAKFQAKRDSYKAFVNAKNDKERENIVRENCAHFINKTQCQDIDAIMKKSGKRTYGEQRVKYKQKYLEKTEGLTVFEYKRQQWEKIKKEKANQ